MEWLADLWAKIKQFLLSMIPGIVQEYVKNTLLVGLGGFWGWLAGLVSEYVIDYIKVVVKYFQDKIKGDRAVDKNQTAKEVLAEETQKIIDDAGGVDKLTPEQIEEIRRKKIELEEGGFNESQG